MKDNYIKIDVYHQRVYITDLEDAKKYCEGYDLSSYEAITYIGYRNRICIYIPEPRDDILVHECVHLANFIADRCDIYYNPKYDEALAYLVGCIYKKLKSKLKF